jgi:hypothetical protein
MKTLKSIYFLIAVKLIAKLFEKPFPCFLFAGSRTGSRLPFVQVNKRKQKCLFNAVTNRSRPAGVVTTVVAGYR